MIYKLLFFCFLYNGLSAQDFTKQDSIRGSVTAERVWWNVLDYTLDINIFPNEEIINGSNTITYKVLKTNNTLQLELQKPLLIDSIIQNKHQLKYKKEGDSYFINIIDEQKIGTHQKLIIYYHGKPKKAKNAPWDGGIVWAKDNEGYDFIANANQTIGSSVWWPCKDHPYDEAESMKITVTCLSSLMSVSNGRNIKTTQNSNQTTSYTWKVENPINSYGVSFNIANYSFFSEVFKGVNGDLNCSYFVLPYHLAKAKTHFKDVFKTLTAFEYWLGPYPFYEDEFKIVETPYLGMEHQSCIAYGNEYLKGYLGYPIGNSKWGLNFDFIIVHEMGHEWFANSVTCNDVADLWLHESFTSYSESLFLDYHYGTNACNEYVQGLRETIKNDIPIIGYYNVNNEGSADMYNKGSFMLHTLRQIINDDERWRGILRGIQKEFYHQTVSGQQVIDYINKETKLDVNAFFKQYLTTTIIPKLMIKKNKNLISYKWENVIDGFEIPVKIFVNEKEVWIVPQKDKWKHLEGNNLEVVVDQNFYIDVGKM